MQNKCYSICGGGCGNMYTNQSLVDDLVKTINGEYTAIECYGKLIQKAPEGPERDRITEIRADEMRHLEMFSRIYTILTGQQPQPQLTEKCAEKYHEGLKAAFMDEQEAVDFYHEMARTVTEPSIRDAYAQAAGDEQNHAVWFLYFLTDHHKKD